MWGEQNYVSFEMAVGGIEPPSPQLTVQRSTVRPPLPISFSCINENLSVVDICFQIRLCALIAACQNTFFQDQTDKKSRYHSIGQLCQNRKV